MKRVSMPLLVLLLSNVTSACEDTTDAPAPKTEPASTDAGGTADAPTAPRALATLWGATVLADENPDPNVVEVHLAANKARAIVDGKEIDVLAYNGVLPGPIIQARPKQRLIVHFDNHLDEPTTVHWHGLRIPDAMDGSPRIQTPVPPGGSFTYTFDLPDAGSFWYHPHVHTHDQLERGLYGAIVVQSDIDPAYDLERSLVLDDVLFDDTGAIAKESLDSLTGLTGRWGKVLLTNGKSAKEARGTATKGQVERWRIVNAANARKFSLAVEGARVRVIGTDSGLLPAPVAMSTVPIPAGGRVDLEVSYDAARAVKLLDGSNGAEATTMLAIDVADAQATPREIPWPVVPPILAEREATQSFTFTYDFVDDPAGPMWTVNGMTHMMDPVLTVPQGTAVKLTLRNGSVGVEHPFHLHGQFFRVHDGAWPGLRDTVMVPSTGSLQVTAYFDNPGRWMAHCHILEHAELGMMSEIEVTPR